MTGNKEDVRDFIRKNYAEVAQKSSEGGCCGGGCSCSGAPMDINETSIKIGYTEGDLSSVPLEANMGLGCGNPLAIAALKKGESVLDLGSGGGFDCFLARKQVGETGYVIGVDMTPDMIKLARKNAEKSGYTNVEFRLGEIEHLPVADSSVDVIISNCVINLSLDKEQVFREAFRVLKPGGRLSTSDVVATTQLPQNIKNDLGLIASCIGGAEYVEDIKAMLKRAGFKDIRMTPKENSREIVKSWAPDKNIEDYVASYIIEAKKGDDKVNLSKPCCSPSTTEVKKGDGKAKLSKLCCSTSIIEAKKGDDKAKLSKLCCSTSIIEAKKGDGKAKLSKLCCSPLIKSRCC